ncbi:MAG: hypothetical protein WCK85_09615 [Chlorobium sp.]
MSKISDVKAAVVSFLEETISSNDITIIKIEKVGDSWKAVAEVYEDDSFLKSMNLPPKKTRTFYSVLVDSDLEVISYNRTSLYDESDSESD